MSYRTGDKVVVKKGATGLAKHFIGEEVTIVRVYNGKEGYTAEAQNGEQFSLVPSEILKPEPITLADLEVVRAMYLDILSL
jgi:hypothetical protein